MFGSQALETIIGLAAMFFILATAASSVTEFISRFFSKRAKDLEKSIAALFQGDNLEKILESVKDAIDKDKEKHKKEHKTGKKADGTALTTEEKKQVKDRLKQTPTPHGKVLEWLKETSVWQSAAASSGKTLWRRKPKGPSYLSAKQFADAVTELLTNHPLTPAATTTDHDPNVTGGDPTNSAPAPATTAQKTQQVGVKLKATVAPDSKAGDLAWPDNLKNRLDAMIEEGRTDLISLKAGIEAWFDESMGRAEGAYKRWATLVLFLVGLFLAGFLNLSTISTASALWRDPVTREAVANSATALSADGKKTDIKSVADAANKVESLKIPGGWDDAHKKVWTEKAWYVVTTPRLSDLAGWLLTALLVMLGAPFWFDLLGKLVSIRGSGAKPDPATKDDSSATTAAAATTTTTTDTSNVIGNVTPVGPASDAFARKVGLIPDTP